MIPPWLQKFLLPDLDRKFLIRVLLVAGAAFILFKCILIPFRVGGFSMFPTYKDGDDAWLFTGIRGVDVLEK